MNDTFRPDLFTMQAMTAAVNDAPYVPARIKEVGLFDEKGVATTSVVVEMLSGTLNIVASQPRGAPGQVNKDDKRTGIALAIPHLPQQDTLMADSIQGVREFASESATRTITSARDEKIHKMHRNLEYTHEYHRLGAIQGIILDANGTDVILNLFTAFGVSEPAEVDFDLDNASPVSGAVRNKCNAIKRAMHTALRGQPFTDIWAPCGDEFWDALTQHPEVIKTFLNQQEANELRGKHGAVYSSFRYGDILFENYRGFGPVAIGSQKCRFVPIGVPDLFQTRFAPGNYINAVNTDGLPYYASAEDLGHGKGYSLEAQSNPLHICTRPATLLRGRMT